MKHIRLVFVALSVMSAALVVAPRPAAALISGTGLNCYGGFAGVGATWSPGETGVVILKCAVSQPTPTVITDWLGAGCVGSPPPTTAAMSLYYTGTTHGTVSLGSGDTNWCNGISTGLSSVSIGFAYGDIAAVGGGTLSSNFTGYPSGYFSLTIAGTRPSGGSSHWNAITGLGWSSTNYQAGGGVTQAQSVFEAFGNVSEPCGSDPTCTHFHEDWPENYTGGGEWPGPICEDFAVDWNPDGDVTLAAGDRQRVTITAPYAQWDDLELRYSWDWGYDPLNGWDETSTPAVYLVPIVESQTATTITLVSAPVGSPRSNSQFHIRCNPDDPLQDLVYYRRAYGDLSTSDGPSRRACYFLRFTIDGPNSPTWDTERTGRLWVEDDDRYDDAGGIVNVEYSWRPTDGVRVNEPFTIDGAALPWPTSPVDVDVSVDVSGFTGPTTGTQSIRCEDSVGVTYLVAGYARPTLVDDTGGSGDGVIEGGTGGVGGEGGGGSSGGSGGDPEPGEAGGTGSGAVGDGPGDGASCFDVAGWSLTSPSSWVFGGIKVGACYLRALVFPRTSVISAEYAELQATMDAHAPFSWFAAGIELVDEFTDALPAALTASASDCYSYGAAGGGGVDGLELVPALEICPAASLSSSGWNAYRPWAGHFVWFTWAIGAMMAAGKLWGMGSTETFYVANEYNPGGV